MTRLLTRSGTSSEIRPEISRSVPCSGALGEPTLLMCTNAHHQPRDTSRARRPDRLRVFALAGVVRAPTGDPPTFLATRTEAVWELAEHLYVYYIEERTDGTRTPIFRAPIFAPGSWAETLYVSEPASQTGHGLGDEGAGWRRVCRRCEPYLWQRPSSAGCRASGHARSIHALWG